MGRGSISLVFADPVFMLRNAPYLSIRDKPSKQQEQFPVPLQANSPTHMVGPPAQLGHATMPCAPVRMGGCHLLPRGLCPVRIPVYLDSVPSFSGLAPIPADIMWT